LGVDQVYDLDPIPFVPNKQVLIGRKRLDAFGELLYEIFGMARDDPVGDSIHHAEYVLGAMIDLAHEEVQLFLALFVFGNVRYRTDDADCSSVIPVTLKIDKAQSLHPADIIVSMTDAELVSVAPRLGGIEQCVKGHLDSFCIVGMHPIHELYNCGLILRDAQNLFAPRIPGKDPAERIVLP
jgi:hypothetical protein